MWFPLTLRRVVDGAQRLRTAGMGTATRTSGAHLAAPLTVKRYKSELRGQHTLFLSNKDITQLKHELAVLRQCRLEKTPVPFTYKSLGEKYGLDGKLVSKLALEWGLREPGVWVPTRPQEEWDLLRSDWEAVSCDPSYKVTSSDLARTHGFSLTSVFSWAQAEGLKSGYEAMRGAIKPMGLTKSRQSLETLLSLRKDLDAFRERRTDDDKSPYAAFTEIGAKYNMHPVIVSVYDYRWKKEVPIDLFSTGGAFDESSTGTVHDALKTLNQLGIRFDQLPINTLRKRYGVTRDTLYKLTRPPDYKEPKLRPGVATPAYLVSDIAQHLLSYPSGLVPTSYVARTFGVSQRTVHCLAHNMGLYGDASKTYPSPKPPQWFLDGFTSPPPTPGDASSSESPSPTTASGSSKRAPKAKTPKSPKTPKTPKAPKTPKTPTTPKASS